MAASDDPSDLTWTDEGSPRSRRFDDVYFSGDGLAESRAVFLQGCGLPEAWRGRRRFTVAELGFGTGLNILSLLDLWRRTRPEGGRLQVFSVEAFLMKRADAERALAAFPELADLADLFIGQWPRIGSGWTRLDFPQCGAVLDLALEEAGAALRGWSGRADVWFLDGFAPSRNPEMWRPELLDLVAARSAPGARLATFTVAGEVRRGLAGRGFAVERLPGHGRKKQRLEGRMGGAPPEEGVAPRVAVIGGGIAGASLARAFDRLGATARVMDPSTGGGASGAPVALAAPRLDVGHGPLARLYAQAHTRAVALYRREAPGAVIAEGALHLAANDRDPGRFERLSASPLLPAGSLQALGSDQAGERLGEPAGPGLWMADAVTLHPERLLTRWLDSTEPRRVLRLEQAQGAWRLMLDDGTALEADIVCLAAGFETAGLAGLDLQPVRGQLTWSAALAAAPVAASWGGYAAPTREGGVLFGATHRRDSTSAEVDPDEEALNLRTLSERRPALAQAVLAAGPLRSRAAVRAATPDRAPLAGALGAGLFVLSGLGGRGFTTAPLLAEHVAALSLGAPSPLAADLAEAVDPGRFQARAARRTIGSSRPSRAPL